MSGCSSSSEQLVFSVKYAVIRTARLSDTISHFVFCIFDCSMTADALEMFSTLPECFNGLMHDSFELFCFGCSCDSVGDDVDVLYSKL